MPIKLAHFYGTEKLMYNYFFHSMNTYVYILTDSNRNGLHVGMTDDLQKAAKTYRELKSLFFGDSVNASRLVYQEAFPNEEDALHKFQELSRYTRMQKERLIRRHNPNWLDLAIAGRGRFPFGYLGSAANSRLSY